MSDGEAIVRLVLIWIPAVVVAVSLVNTEEGSNLGKTISPANEYDRIPLILLLLLIIVPIAPRCIGEG